MDLMKLYGPSIGTIFAGNWISPLIGVHSIHYYNIHLFLCLNRFSHTDLYKLQSELKVNTNEVI